jgi:hypothetical protein
MNTVQLPAEQRFVMSCIDWDTYVTIGDKLGERNIRINYDGANLEFMTSSLAELYPHLRNCLTSHQLRFVNF